MKIPLSYIWRSLWTRRLTTALTLLGVTLVIFVFSAILMLASGIERTMTESGYEDNVIIVRRSAASELLSQVGREAAGIIKTLPEVATDASGKAIATTEILVVINQFKKESNDLGNVSVRGVSPEAFTLRPGVRLASGRLFQFGTHEVVVGSSIAKRFKNMEIGKQITFSGDQWSIVGVIESDGSAFESEIWGDVDQLMPAVGRPIYSTVTFRLRDKGLFDAAKERIQKDPRTQSVEPKRERTFYKQQSQAMASFIIVLGGCVTFIFGIGAVIGAVITMYGAVSNRTVEIGTLRALGFRRRSILTAFLIEAIILSLVGGALGVLCSLAVTFIRLSTVNFGTFSELAFGFTLTPGVAVATMIASVIMGIVGGVFPAVRAARMNIVSALRSS
jgi:ABC-type antimicrobial peptide transport system permease subunit